MLVKVMLLKGRVSLIAVRNRETFEGVSESVHFGVVIDKNGGCRKEVKNNVHS